MAFAVPWMLLGLAAIAVPVLLHLVERRHARGRGFPSVMFIERLQTRREKRKTLRDRGLLALRCLALVLVTLAFAEPYLPAPAADADGAPGGVDRVYLLDASHSMSRGGTWQRAVDGAGRDVDSLGEDDRAAIVAFDDEPRRVLGLTADRAALRGALGSLEPGHGGSDFGAALSAARALLADSEAPRREIVLVSDLAITSAARPMMLPVDLPLRLLPAQTDRTPGVIVTGAGWRPAGSADAGARLLFVRLRGTGLDTPADALVGISVDGYAVEERRVRVSADDDTTFQVALAAGGEQASRVVVETRLADGGASSRFHLVAAPRRAIEVVVVGSGARDDGAFFVERALALAQNPPVEITRRTAGGLGPADVADASVMVLVDVDPSAAPLPARLAEHRARGGGLLVWAGEGFRAWPGDLAGQLPAALDAAGFSDEAAGGEMVLAADHVLGRALSRALGTDVVGGEVYRHRRFASVDDGVVLAHLADGVPAAVAGGGDGGRVIVFATGLSQGWSSLVREAAFAPLMIESVRHLAGRSPIPAYHVAGTRIDLAAHLDDVARAAGLDRSAAERALVLTDPGGRSEEIASSRRVLALDEPGIYTVRELAVGGLSVALAVNVDPAENVAEPVSAEAFLARVSRPASPPPVAGTATREPPPRRELWWWLLAAALALFVTEALLANRPRRPGNGAASRAQDAGAS